MSDDVPSIAPRRRPAALGRGLGALLGESRRDAVIAPEGAASSGQGGGGATLLSIAAITPNPDQPRRHFDEDALAELAASIARRGVLQPIIVRPHGKGYQLVAGERRWRAAQRAQVHEIPAIVQDLSDADVAAVALIENLQREDLNPVEEARAYQRLVEEQDLTQADLATLVDKSRSHVANLMRLLQLPDPVLALIDAGSLSMGHARALVGHPEAEILARQAVDGGLSVREVETLARKAPASESRSRKPRAAREATVDADIAALQNDLEDVLGLKVRIVSEGDPQAGAVTISYRTLDQLDLICQRLSGRGV